MDRTTRIFAELMGGAPSELMLSEGMQAFRACRGGLRKALTEAYAAMREMHNKEWPVRFANEGCPAGVPPLTMDGFDRLGRYEEPPPTPRPRRRVSGGRRRALTPEQAQIARERMWNGESTRKIAKEWGVSHTTIARAR